MSATFLVVPQWQGSGSSRAMQLVDGAEAIRGDLPTASTRVVEVPLESGDGEGTGIQRWSSLQLVRQRMSVALGEIDGPVITIGGDCGVDHAAISRAVSDGDVALVWFDGHADAHSVETSTTGAFHGMVVRALVDDGVLPADRVVLAGTRSWDDGEPEWLREAVVTQVGVEGIRDPGALIEAVAATGATRVYLHVDLDVLDPGEIGGLGFPEPFGVTTAELVAAIRALGERFGFAGGSVLEFAPASVEAAADDLGVILRVVGALAAAAR